MENKISKSTLLNFASDLEAFNYFLNKSDLASFNNERFETIAHEIWKDRWESDPAYILERVEKADEELNYVWDQIRYCSPEYSMAYGRFKDPEKYFSLRYYYNCAASNYWYNIRPYINQ